MALIIFQRRQAVSFQRFTLSVFSGAVLLLCLGVVHGWLHGSDAAMVDIRAVLEARLVLLAAAIGIILGVIYFGAGGPAAWSERTMVETRGGQREPLGFSHAGQIRRFLAVVVAGDILLFGLGLQQLVLRPIFSHLDLASAMGSLALASVAVFLPLHYAALLKLDAYTARVSPETCVFAERRFGQILYWVLVAFWASLLAGYVMLLISSWPYCKLTFC